MIIGVVWMNKIVKLFKESIWDMLKDNIVTAITALIILATPFATSFFTNLKNIELTFNLPIVIGVIALITILVLALVQISKRNKALKKENYDLQYPENPNVNKFNKGDIVIRKIEAENSAAETLSVVNKTRSGIECRKMDGQIINFTPEELLTSDATKEALENSRLRKTASVQRIAQANRQKGSRGFEF